MVCGSKKEAASTLSVGKGVKLVIVIEPLSKMERDSLTAINPSIQLITFDELEAEGRRYGKRVKHRYPSMHPLAVSRAYQWFHLDGLTSFCMHSPPSPNSVATFCYTSGTTGKPKGALISHQNIMAAVSAVEVKVASVRDVCVCGWPLHDACVGERMCMTCWFVNVFRSRA